MSNLDDVNKAIQLYDIYKELLTAKQQEYFELYYYEDLSLQEIAQNLEVSRNAVHRNLQNTIQLLNQYESKLALLNKEGKLIKALELLKQKYSINDTDIEQILKEIN